MPWSSYQVFIILPTGATVGKRIVLDGGQGLIGVYDDASNLVGSMAAAGSQNGAIVNWLPGVAIYSSANKYSIRMSSDFGIAFDAYPDSSQFTAGGLILPSNPTAPGADPRPALLFQSPASDANKQLLFMGMYSSKTDGTGTPQQLFVGGRNGLTNATMRGDIGVCGFVQPYKTNGTAYAAELWTAPTFANGWRNDPNPPRNQPVQFRIRPDGWVNMRGVAALGTNLAGTLIASVPMYYAPIQTEWFVCACPFSPGSFSTVRVEANGNIVLENPATADNICFSNVSWATGAAA